MVQWLKETLRQGQRWLNSNFTFGGVVAFFWFLLKVIPDMFGVKDFWSGHAAVIWRYVAAHSTVSVTVVCALLIWLDNRRVIQKRGPRPHDRKTLKGRLLQLRDDLSAFLQSVGDEPKAPPETNLTNWLNDEEWVKWRAASSARIDKIHYGYELRFSERTRAAINELGEQGKLPMGLCTAFDRPGKTEETIRELIAYLDSAINLLAS